MGMIHVVKPGMLTTIQDRGRWGFQARGVPVGGPMDPFSHRLANALVGNTDLAATLEVTLLGPELEFDGPCVVAIAGAAFEVTVDGQPFPVGSSAAVRGGARLRFGARTGGARAYLAVSGGIDTPPVLGSRATHVVSGMGGLAGRPLKAGDRVPFAAASTRAARQIDRVARHVPAAWRDSPAIIRVLPGPQVEFFSANAFDVLQAKPYVVSGKSDRMGFRLDGVPLTHSRGADTISDATPLGALQVPASGLPILLMADRQTTGGYPKVATVIAADLCVAGQLGPGDQIVFKASTRREAIAALIAQERALMSVDAR